MEVIQLKTRGLVGKTILNIKILYSDMGKAEKKIAEFLMEKPDRILPLSITELAEKCGCGEATIVRFSRRLGFDGYQQLKISIAQEENIHSINENIAPEDSAFDVLQKVCNDVYSSLEKTKKAINKDALEKSCLALLSARNIYIFGLGNSASVAADAEHKLLRLGFHAHAYTDNHMQAIAAAHTQAGDVVIGISHSGSSKDIVQSMQLAKINGATAIAITNYGKSPINKISDYILNTVSDETNYSILGLNSRIAQLAIIDAIYSYLVCHLPDSKNLIHKTESALQPKKY